jgi:hypothetical protein
MWVARTANAAFWLAAWLGIAIAFHGFDHPGRLPAQAAVPVIACTLLDWLLRRIASRRAQTRANASAENRARHAAARPHRR